MEQELGNGLSAFPTADEELIELLEAQNEHYLYNKIDLYYPDHDLCFMGQTFPARSKYERYLQHFAAGKHVLERAAFCGNQIGKSESLCGYECARHAIGIYPYWWDGWRVSKPLTILCAGKTSATTRDIVQYKLFGDADTGDDSLKAIDRYGTGLIPKSHILKVKYQAGGAPGAIDTAYIKSAFHSKVPTKLIFRSYEQGRKAAEGLVLDFIWIDEESDPDFYGEAKRGLLNTDGRMVMSFTPLDGVTNMVIRTIGETGVPPSYDPSLFREEVDNMLRLREAA